jgi:DNA-binding response OmpR family regulator
MACASAAPILLYVEDELITQTIVEAALREAGFPVVASCNGTDALAILRLGNVTFSGLITDIDLGDGPNGWDVARIARRVSRGVPVVYVSGASGHDWLSEGVPNSVMIAKPFAPSQIVVAVSSLLAPAEPTP